MELTHNPLLIPEILEVVFRYVDGMSLLRCTQVCRLWRQVEQNLSKVSQVLNEFGQQMLPVKRKYASLLYCASNLISSQCTVLNNVAIESLQRRQQHVMLQFSKVWQYCCLNEIPKDVLLDISISLQPSWMSDRKTTIDWKQIYKSWKEWHFFGNWNIDKKNEHLKQITSLKISGDSVVLGNASGQVLLWKTGCSPIRLAQHLRSVTDIGLISCSEHKSDDVNQFSYIHDLVISTSGDFTIQVNHIGVIYKKPVILREHGAATLMVRVFQKEFAVLSEDEHISMWRLVGISDAFQIQKLMNVRLSVIPFKAVSVWWCFDGVEAYGLLTTGHRVRLHKNLYHPYIPSAEHLPVPLVQGIQKFLIWRNRVCIGINYLGLIFINAATMDYKQLSTFDVLDAPARVIHLHGEMLMIGTEGGTLYLYQLKSENDLLSLDLTSYVWKYNVQTMEPILAVDIQESTSGKIIAAATYQGIFMLTLFSSLWSTQSSAEV